MRSIPSLQIWTYFLHMLTRHLSKLTFATVSSMHRKLATGWEECVGEVHCAEDDRGQVEGIYEQGKTSDGVCDAVSRIHVPLVSSKSLICHFPSLFLPSSHAAPDSVLWME